MNMNQRVVRGVIVAVALLALAWPGAFARSLTFEERVTAQKAIERVYYSHQIGASKSFEEAVPLSVLESKVRTYLERSAALERAWHAPVTAEMLVGELARIESQTRMPERLREMYAALGNDTFLIQECIARPALVDRLTRSRFAQAPAATPAQEASASCLPDDTWSTTATGLAQGPTGRYFHRAVWTGNEMIVWGGEYQDHGNEIYLDSGGRYDPALDRWTPTSTVNAPSPRILHSAVWTGGTMIVWGGLDASLAAVNTGGRYDPLTDTWTPTSLTGAPSVRDSHAAVWTGNQMIVWGGGSGASFPSAGGRYDPVTDTWTPTSGFSGRRYPTAVWTGSVMIVWGGRVNEARLNSGARYNPVTDTWAATKVSGAPEARMAHTAVWTGSKMIIWGGNSDGSGDLNNGGIYDPVTNSWATTLVAGAPQARESHSAVWTGSKMIVWGGWSTMNTGGVFDPVANSWTTTSLTDAPSARQLHTAVWTGSSMIVWGGFGNVIPGLGDGGSYAWGQSLDSDGDGYSACAGDCNDGNLAVHPGATEVCDGLDNDCSGFADDGIASPNGTLSLAASKSGTDAAISWAPIAGASAYDAVEGSLTLLATTAGDFQTATSVCIADNVTATSATSTSTPSPGDGVWVLVRGSNCGGDGSYNESTGNQQGSRDAEIASSGNACP